MSVATLSCPYCGLPKWVRVEKVLSNTRLYLIVSICKCENCGKMFYICRTSMCTFTVKFDEVNQEELIGTAKSRTRKGSRKRTASRSRSSRSSRERENKQSS